MNKEHMLNSGVLHEYVAPKTRFVPLKMQTPLCTSNDGQTENYDEEDDFAA